MATAHHRVPITVRLDHFEGPLDLLLYLIQSHELNISTVSLSKITDQYLAYIRLMQNLDFDIAGDFLVMAATLIKWKSAAILPQEEDQQNADEEDDGPSPEELVRRLLEHRRFLAAGQDLLQFPRLHDEVFHRPNHKPPIHRIWRDMNITDLALSYQDSLVKERKRKTVLRKETVSIAGRIEQLGKLLELEALTNLKATLPDEYDRPELVVSFLASLELARLKKLLIFQEGTYQDIFIKLIESLKNFDLSFASGFEAENQNAQQNQTAATDAAPNPVPEVSS